MGRADDDRAARDPRPTPTTGDTARSGTESRVLALARAIDPQRAAVVEAELAGIAPSAAVARAVLLATAYEALTGAVLRAPSTIPPPHAADRDALHKALRRYLAAGDADEHRPRLRRFAERQRLRIALRELLPPSLGGADFETTAGELSALADVTIEAALEEATGAVLARTGPPVDEHGALGRLTVLGMGKLGGEELNAGSDVDLVCFYDSDDHVARHDGRELSAHEVWTRVVRRMTSTLADVTDDGFVWRVDHRLRPEGSRGPLVNSLAAAERYYETFGRLWERSAWIRARPVAGDLELGERVIELLGPFVWRRVVDPSIAASMYELVHRARAELSAVSDRDLKLGPGGIREAEFFVQSLQLIWGGREHRIRTRPTLDACHRLRSAGLITEHEADELAGAYIALRRAEHAVQWSSGQQTHSLPTDPVALERIARTLGFEGSGAFIGDLQAQHERVGRLLRSLSPTGDVETPRWNDALLALDHDDLPAFEEALVAAGLPGADDQQHGQLVRDLFETARVHPDSVLGAHTRDRRRHLADTLLDAVAGSADPTQAGRYLRGFATRLASPSIYANLLANDPAAVRRLVTVLGGSAFVGELVATRPELADQVLFEPVIPSPDDARLEVLDAWRAAAAEEDLETRVGRIRKAVARVTTQIALADLAEELDTRRSTEVLSALADEALETAARIALGTPSVRGLAIVAMGKLGGREIGYGSDLDVIFLFEPEAAPEGTEATRFFTKIARQIIQIVSMPHPDGPAYELDTRLRPSGSQGMLVVSLSAFARYHGVEDEEGAPAPRARGAATWERLALLRARFAAGDAEVGRAAMAIAERAAYRPGQPDDAGLRALAQDVHQLRERMEHELARERPGRYDIKLGRGGLIEVEFATQLLQLAHGAHREVRTTDTREALAGLAAVGALPGEQLAARRDGCDFVRRPQPRIRVVHGDSSHLIEERAAGMIPLARRMGIRESDGHRAAAELIERYRVITERVRRAYEEIVVTPREGAAARVEG